MLKSMRKSKNRYFYHIFVSPGDAPEVITLNVVWMEREFDAYKLSHCMCPSNYNRFWDRARYWSKIVIFSYTLHSTPRLGGGSRWNSAAPFGTEKLEWLGYPMVKKYQRYLYSFWRNSGTWQTDRRTDRRTDGRTPRAGIYLNILRDNRRGVSRETKMWAAVRENGDFFAIAVRITGKLLKIDGYMLRGVWQAVNCFFIHATFCVIATGASPGQTKNEGRNT